MKRHLAWLLLFAASLAALGAEAPLPAPPGRWATDGAGFLSAGELARLDARLEAFERATGDQVLVWIGETTGETPIEDWAVRTFAAWKVGCRTCWRRWNVAQLIVGFRSAKAFLSRSERRNRADRVAAATVEALEAVIDMATEPGGPAPGTRPAPGAGRRRRDPQPSRDGTRETPPADGWSHGEFNARNAGDRTPTGLCTIR